MGRFEFLNEAFVFGLVEFEVGSVESSFFGAGLFLGDEFVEVGQIGGFVPCDEVGFHFAGSHQVDAGQKNAVNVKQRLGSRRRFLGEQFPLRCRVMQFCAIDLSSSCSGVANTSGNGCEQTCCIIFSCGIFW